MQNTLSLSVISKGLIIDHVDAVRHLRTAATSEPIVHPPGDM
jgi:aspartate carbamoyltransferase regulatory subunit